MKNNVMLGIAVSLSLFSLSPSALAEPFHESVASTQPTQSGSGQLSQPQPNVQLAPQPNTQSMAIIVAFPSQVDFNITKQQQQPATLLLAQPVVNSAGEVIAPVNSPVKATLVATEEGATIQVEAIIVSGQVLPVLAISSELPSTEIVVSTDSQNSGKGARFWGKTGMAIGCVFGGCSIESQRVGGSAGAVIGAFSGNRNGSDTERVVQVAPNSVYILPIQVQ